MTAEEKLEVVEEYRVDIQMLKKIVELAEEVHYRSRGNIEVQSYLENVLANVKNAIIELAEEFADNEMHEGEMVGYAFTWLAKLKSAENDSERAEILKDWLKEIEAKESAE